MNNAFGVLFFLAALVASVWYGLKFCDWVRAVQYEWRKSKKKAVPASPGPKTGVLPDGYFAPGIIRVHSTIVYNYSTPDRPSDPIRQEIDALTGKAEAVNYPRGS